ncbi:kunitz-type protease inhibitor 2 [Cyprinodon tularosa]|uniref:kunitz-type protease inhibitor 2 n=1 Tax=Cyprinodon tularosa TaxID=77115 RepID=UPI0018E276BC|nr:kunitz-type protease inhibitor 2 [Cyprinodon tularosa]
MFQAKLIALCFLLQTGLTQNCDWDQSTDPNQNLAPDALKAGARYLGHIQEVSDAETCRTACCQDSDCDLALIGLPMDGGMQCMLVSCGTGGCSLQRSSQFQVYRKKSQNRAEQEEPAGGDKIHVVPLMEAEEPKSNATNSDLCRLPKKTGPCRAAFPRFFYNVTSQSCSTFIFGGCEANGNNFVSQGECEATCSGVTGSVLTEDQTSSPPPAAPKAPRMAPLESAPLKKTEIQTDDYAEKCEAKYQTGPCRASIQRWFYNKETGNCQTFIFGGCRGNKNNYPDEDSCKSACVGISVLPSSKKVPEDKEASAERCSLSPEGGLCRAYFPKFYYDPDTASCQSFVYGGCGGNANNFNTIEECMAACSGAGLFDSRGKTKSRWTAAAFLFVTLAAISALLLATLVVITLRRRRLSRSYSTISDKQGLIPDRDELSSQDSMSIPESPRPEPKA